MNTKLPSFDEDFGNSAEKNSLSSGLPVFDDFEKDLNFEEDNEEDKSYVKSNESAKGYGEEYELLEKLMFTDEMSDEYEEIKQNYENLIDGIQENINELEENDEEEIEISDLNLIAEVGEVDQLVQDLYSFEEKLSHRDLDEYNIKTTDDFREAVDNGVLNLENYEEEEINQLVEGLEERELTFEDYDTTFFGDVEIEEVTTKIEHEESNLNIRDLERIKAKRNKPIELPKAPQPIKEKETNKKKYKPNKEEFKEIANTEEIDNEMDVGFFQSLVKIIKSIFKRE